MLLFILFSILLGSGKMGGAPFYDPCEDLGYTYVWWFGWGLWALTVIGGLLIARVLGVHLATSLPVMLLACGIFFKMGGREDLDRDIKLLWFRMRQPRDLA